MISIQSGFGSSPAAASGSGSLPAIIQQDSSCISIIQCSNLAILPPSTYDDDPCPELIGHLDRFFQQDMGITPVNYLNRYRVRQAKTLLQQTDSSLTEIALAVGFSSSSHFSRVFRKHFGFGPSATGGIGFFWVPCSRGSPGGASPVS